MPIVNAKKFWDEAMKVARENMKDWKSTGFMEETLEEFLDRTNASNRKPIILDDR